MAMKKPGRVRSICIRCEANFSTHSSNRQMCHKCLPKCREKHYFLEVPQTKTDGKEGKNKENKEQNKEEEKI